MSGHFIVHLEKKGAGEIWALRQTGLSGPWAAEASVRALGVDASAVR
jgi:hypothetical protein